MREWLEALEAGETVDALPVLAYAAGIEIDLGDGVHGATRRALLLLAAGGDPRRGLDLNGRAVTALADELDEPERRVELELGLIALERQAADLPRVREALTALRAEPSLAWRAFAAGVLADSLEDD